VGLEEVRPHRLAGGGALVDDLHQRDARPVHDDPGGAWRDVQLGGQLLVGEPVELSPYQRVAVAGRQRAEILEQLAQVGTALVCRRRLVARCGREVIAIDRVQVDAVGPHPAELVEAAVAHQPVEPWPQVHRAVVAPQRAVRAPQCLLHDILGGAAIAQDPCGEAQQRCPVTVVDLLERRLVAGAKRGDKALVGDPARHR
jgi:hypothetical protein